MARSCTKNRARLTSWNCGARSLPTSRQTTKASTVTGSNQRRRTKNGVAVLCDPWKRKISEMPPDSNEPPDPKKSVWVQVGRYTQFAFMLPAGTVAGWLLGSLLDRWL